MNEEKKTTEVVHFLDVEEFAKASETERRKMVRDMLVAISRKNGGELEQD